MSNLTTGKRLALGSRVLGLFATPLHPRRYVELVRPFWGAEAHLARVEGVARETADVTTLVLRPNRPLKAHRAGQHIAVGVTIDGVRLTRVFSISSAPNRDDGCLTITVKKKGRVSSFLHHAIARGDVVVIGEPRGEFTWPSKMPERALFVTAGSGITPVMSMLRALENAGAQRPIHVVHLHYAKNADDVIFARELAAMRSDRYRLDLIFSASSRERFSATTLVAKCPDFQARNAWACGPTSLLDAIESQYERAGLAHALRTERFGATFAPPVDGACAGGMVRFLWSEREVRADGKTPLLVVAERAGLSPPHGCRMGICHTCDVTLRAGCARDLRTGRIIDEPGSKIRICVSAAATDVEMDR